MNAIHKMFHLAISGLLIAECSAHPPFSAAETLRSPVSFRGTRGINVFGPLGGPVSSAGSYPADPYSHSIWGPISSHLTSAVAAQIKAAGFDFVRLQADVGPCIQAVEQGRDMSELDAANDSAIGVFENAKLAVLFSPYFGGRTIFDDSRAFLRGLGTLRYQNLVACEQHWAERYGKRYSSTSFGLDPFNEPPLVAGSSWQGLIMPSLYASIRAYAPNVTLVITSGNYGDFTLLVGGSYRGEVNPQRGIDPRRYKNVLFTFHQFLPSVFADQGEAYSPFYKYVTGLNFPPNVDQERVVLLRMTENVEADRSLDSSRKQSIKTQLYHEIEDYFDVPEGQVWLGGLFNQVITWCRYWGLHSDSVLLGEWGAPRQPAMWFNEYGQAVPNVDSHGSVQGASRLSIINYDESVQDAASARGFRTAVDHLDTYDLGQTIGTGSTIGAFDPLKLKALRDSSQKPEPGH